MPKYTHADGVRWGVPLGGIGAGSMEILPDGRFANFTFLNNWTSPMAENLGSFFAVYWETASARCIRVLQKEGVADIRGISGLEYSGMYPQSAIEYMDESFPFRLTLKAGSGFIPGDYKNSSLPAAFFTFSVSDVTEPVTVSVLFSFRNICGRWNVGRFNTLDDNDTCTSITFQTKSAIPGDRTTGDITLALPKGGQWENDWIDCYNVKAHSFNLTRDQIDVSFLSEFRQTGILGRKTAGVSPLTGERLEIGGCLAAKAFLEPGKSLEVPLYLSWYFPLHEVEHMYTAWAGSSRDINAYIIENAASIIQRTCDFQDSVRSLALPDWFKDALINNLYVMTSASWYGKDGRFALYESPLDCPLMGTIDVFTYTSVAVSLLFPELEKSLLRLFASAQRENGYIPHDLGRDTLTVPNDGTTSPPQWKDLPSKFVLLVYRHSVWHNDTDIVKELYPAAKRTLEWLITTDWNGDFLPDNEGQDQTFDDWPFYSTNSYTSSLYLAALKAAVSMAETVGDYEFKERCSDLYAKGCATFTEKLWNGDFYVSYVNDGEHYDVCTGAQAVGQMFARLCGLGWLQPEENYRKVLASILRLNHQASRYGMVNAVFPDGTVDFSRSQSGAIWPGVNYAAAAFAVQMGAVDDGLAIAEKMWRHIAENEKKAWNQADNIDSRTGRFLFGDRYMRNMAVWLVLVAIAEHNDSVREFVGRYISTPVPGPAKV